MNYTEFLRNIRQYVPKQDIYTDALRCLAWGTDAGFYRLTPKVVIRAKDRHQVQQILKTASAHNVPVTFRAAGTSLSGQAISDSVLIVAGKNWEDYEINADGSLITMQPGIVGARVNQLLAPYNRFFQPDPASKNSAMVGGIVINNASGMNCGTHANSDHVMVSAQIVLADGTFLDTADAKSREEFTQTHPELIAEIEAIREEIRNDSELSELINRKYAIKNVTGLNLRPFVAFDNPFDIIAHCMVGSEGTLAFLASVTCRTAPIKPHVASVMLYFTEMQEACNAVVALKKSGLVDSCEMLDKKSLASVNDATGDGLTALLMDTKADTQAQLNEQISGIKAILANYKLFDRSINFTTDPAVYGPWWAIRSGIFPAVGGTRKPGTTVLIEDVAFQIDDLPMATADLAQLLVDCGYNDACIYGHALEGNYHFVIAQSFETEEDIDQYRNMMKAIEQLVVDKYHGSLKAEHGTGRNMAPFVEKEWGTKAYALMRRLKDAMDPQGILNPGVIFNDDPECYIKNIKHLPLTNKHVDKCIECGFCEVNCVSCGFTLSARQRIAVQREITYLLNTNTEAERRKQLEKLFKYFGNQTCAGDGLCSTSCPMKINTGEMIHDLRQKAIPKGSTAYKTGDWAANHLAGIEATLRPVLNVANATRAVIGNDTVNILGRALNKCGVPLWSAALPGASKTKVEQPNLPRKVVYFPSCINQTMGPTAEKGKKVESLVKVIARLCNKAGYEVVFPKNMKKLCCGMIWESKGMPDIANAKTAELEAALLEASENGRIPVLCDQSPCLHRMRDHIKSLKLYEPAEFISEYLMPYLNFEPISDPVAVHVTCSTRRMGLASTIINLAAMCSTNVIVPSEIGCCGFAGDKGFMLPKLNQWALRKLKPQLQVAGVERGFSNSRTCEIGLSTNSGITYKSIAYLVDEVTKPTDSALPKTSLLNL